MNFTMNHLQSPSATQDALQVLLDGNGRFSSGKLEHPHQDQKRRNELLAGQNPIAVILTCSDSRLSPEVIFDQGLGDIFVVRTAGNVLDDIALGSVEYAVEHLHVPLVVVMGHQKCGAVSAVVSGAELTGHLVDIGKEIAPAVAKAKGMKGDLLTNSIDVNIANIVVQLMTSEPILKEFVETNKIKVVGSRYDFDSGKVTIFKEGSSE